MKRKYAKKRKEKKRNKNAFCFSLRVELFSFGVSNQDPRFSLACFKTPLEKQRVERKKKKNDREQINP